MRDAQGHAVTGGTSTAIAHYDAAVRAFALAYGDVIGAFDKARQEAPAFAMGHIGKAWVLALANDAVAVKGAPALLETARALPLNDREQAHASALGHAIGGHRASATRILDRHLMRYPHDLLAHYAAMLLDAFQGRFALVAQRSARALPEWSKEMPGYGILLSFYGFGLEESGDYARAEATGRAAAELEPYGYWPHHAVSHVLEMTARPADGLRWMDERQAFWSGDGNANRVHIWWHKALFHVELGDYEAALKLYDGPVVASQRPLGISLTNATALLWRLELLGADAGHRWHDLAPIWRGHADGRICLFADVHAAMTALSAEDGAEIDRLVAAMRATAASADEQAATYRDIGLPLVEGLRAYRQGDYAGAVEALLPLRAELWRIGGSHAQRDLIEWTLAEAATRAGLRDVAEALANERMAGRPQSAPNKRFLANARALAA